MNIEYQISNSNRPITANTHRDAESDLSKIFLSSSLRNRTSPASTRDGLAFEGDELGVDVNVINLFFAK